MQKAHDGDDDIEALYGVSGTGTRLDANPTESGENIAKLSVVLGEHYSSETEAAVTERLRETMKQYPDIAGRSSVARSCSVSPRRWKSNCAARTWQALQARRPASWPRLMQASPHFADVKSTVEQGYPGDPDPLRPGARRRAGPDHAPDRRPGGAQGARRSRHALQLPRPQDRRAGARAAKQDRASVDDIRRLIVNPGRANGR